MSGQVGHGHGRVALVTGSSRGLGRSIVRFLAASGYSVVVNYHSAQEAAAALVAELQANGGQAAAFGADVSDPSQAASLIERAVDALGRLDVLVLNAGPFIFRHQTLADTDEQDWQAMRSGNLDAAYHLLRASLPIMRRQHHGRIIALAFDRAAEAPGWPGAAAYAAAKVALLSLIRSVALEEASRGITANAVAPGDVRPQWKEATRQQALRPDAAPQAPVGRPGSGEDIARAVAFFAAVESDFVTGNVLYVDGGLDVLARETSVFLRESEQGGRGFGSS